jgi:hypothetical protein
MEKAVIVIRLFAMFEAGGHEDGPPSFGGIKDDRQWDGHRLFMVGEEVKFMTIAYVLKDNFSRVQFRRFLPVCFIGSPRRILGLGYIKKK